MLSQNLEAVASVNREVILSLEIGQDRKMAEECLTPLERLLAQGKELGYSGDDLRKFMEGRKG